MSVLDDLKRTTELYTGRLNRTATEQLHWLQESTGGLIRISKKKVPHLVFRRGDTTYSVVWFGTNRHYRVFWPYPASEQELADFATAGELLIWLEARHGKEEERSDTADEGSDGGQDREET